MLISILATDATPPKGRDLLHAVQEGAGRVGLTAKLLGNEPAPGSDLIVVYGLGGADRIRFAGLPNVVAFDAGYWDRKADPRTTRRYRVSIGGFHCQERIFHGDDPGPERLAQSSITVARECADRMPIMLVGNGPKSNRIGAAGWTAAKAGEIRSLFPKRPIWYRPKPKRPPEQDVGFDVLSHGTRIEDALTQVGLVICRHSNVAIDACRAGVPVVCDDGAAASIYPKRFEDWQDQPSLEKRSEFMRRLAWWQWSPNECRSGELWAWMLKQL